MTELKPHIIYLKDYLPPAFLIETVALVVELGEETTRVAAELRIQRNGQASRNEPLTLDGQDLTLQSLAIDGRPLTAADYRLEAEKLTIYGVPDSFTLSTVCEIKPQENTSLEGLYKSRGTFCTQCEAEGFRKITYFLDRPDVMAMYTTTLIADKEKYPVLLSNGNLIDRGELAENRHWAKWHDPFKKPAYLFALVAGNLRHVEDHFITKSGRKVTLRIYTEEHNIDRCEHAMLSVKQAMRWDEERFGREYDLDIFMLVAINDFNMGAMENKGLNIFNSSCILAKPETATDGDYDRIQAIIAHEYFHNWTGNRITCRDWFQLSLKEGLTVFRDQEFSADMSSAAVKRIADVRALRAVQFAEDSGPMSHPVRPDSYIEINNFYTATVYNKGAEVIRMMQTLLGREGFRRGMDLYFERHDGQAVTIEDFVRVMEDANNVDFTQFMRWYTQAGTPQVTAIGHYDAATRRYRLRLHQSCPPTPGQENKLMFHIPVTVALIDEAGNNLPLQLSDESQESSAPEKVLQLLHKEQSFDFVEVTKRPVLSVLRGFSAPVRLHCEYSDDELVFLMGNDSDEFNRWDAGQQLAIKMLKSMISAHQSRQPLQMHMGFLGSFRKTLLDPHLDKLLVVQTLMLPSSAYLAELIERIDIEAIDAARMFVHQTIAREMKEHLLAIYKANWSSEPYRFDKAAVGRRSLKNLALHYLAYNADQTIIDLCFEQLTAADNMTDAIAALAALVEIDCDERERGLRYFYKKWHDDPLVIDKWLSVQASSRQAGTLQNIQRLMEDPVFDIKNPNKVRALLGGFCFGNMLHFHDANGAGYELLAKQVLCLDKLNPQIAARLVSALSKWRKFDDARQIKMQAQLQRIAATIGISKDTYEIATKSLA